MFTLRLRTLSVVAFARPGRWRAVASHAAAKGARLAPRTFSSKPAPSTPAAAPRARAAVPRVRFSGEPIAAAIRAETLVLSAGTLAFDSSHPDNASITTPNACRDACAALPGCGAWSFCNNAAAGCGKGCKAYVRANPKRENARRHGRVRSRL